MNDVSFHVPYIFGNKQNSKSEEKQTQKEGTTEDRGTWIQARPAAGPNRQERGKTNSQ